MRPNILWMTVDHLLFGNHYGFQPQYTGQLKTFERLCAQGLRFNQAYTVCPLCTPARASMLSGVYPHRHGLVLNPDTDDEPLRRSFEKPEELIARPLVQSGYRAVQLGKWHVGQKLGEEMGFEGWTLPGYGKPYLSQAYREYLARKALPKPRVEVLWDARHPENVGREFSLLDAAAPFNAARRLLTPKETHEAYFMADMAAQWLRQYKREGGARPFMLKLDVWGPHQPYDTAPPFTGCINPATLRQHPSFAEQYKNKPQNYAHSKQFWDCISHMDWPQMSEVLAVAYEHAMLVDDALGGVLDALEALGLAQNTLVILTADHGDVLAAHGGLFNKETLMVEETMRIPLVLRWPGHIAAGTGSEALVSNMDIPATVLQAAGAGEGRQMDGQSLLSATEREQLMCQSFGCRHREFAQRMLRHGPYKYIAHEGDMDELYDLATDPFELENLAASAAYSDVLADMQKRLQAEMRRFGDDGWEAG